jgi:soluble cytochrome b562
MADERQMGSAGDQDLDSTTYLKEAFKIQYNLIALGSLALFALISGSALPIMLGAGLELIYLSVVPQSSRFQRLVRSWKYDEQKRQKEVGLNAIFQELPPEMRLRYADVDKLCRSILENYSHLSASSQMITQQMEQRLQGLAQSYLRLLYAAHQYRQYLLTTSPNAIQKDINDLQKGLATDPPKVQDINRKRIEILTKRLEKFDKAQESGKVVDAQCAAMEEVLQLIRDQSVTLRDPQQVSDQLDNLVKDVEQTEETVKEVESIFDMASPEMAGSLAPLASSMPAPPDADPRRNRLRS